MQLTKAKIQVQFGDERGARVKKEFDVQFNPTEYTRQKAAQIAEIPIYGIDSPILQFVRGQNEKLTLDLFFDTTAGRSGEELQASLEAAAVDVRTLTEPFYQLVKIQPETHAPPRILFSWGENQSFKAIVESVQQKFELFSSEGIPLRATLSLSMREYRTLEEQVSELKPLSADKTKSRTVKPGDTLSRLAAEEYGDPREWRAIADENGLTNPRQLKPGMVLRIPALDVFKKPVVTGQP